MLTLDSIITSGYVAPDTMKYFSDKGYTFVCTVPAKLAHPYAVDTDKLSIFSRYTEPDIDKTNQGKTMDIKSDEQALKPGQPIYCILYHGSSKIETEALYRYLKTYYDNSIPVPLDGMVLPERFRGSKLSVRISDVAVTQIPDVENNQTIYRMTLKGELV